MPANEVIKTVGATARDHSTIIAWEAATDDNCVAGFGAGDYSDPCSPVGDCYDDGDFTDNVTIAGATTDATHYRRLTVHDGERHDGTNNGTGVKSTKYLLIGNYDDYFIAEWLIIDVADGDGTNNTAAYFTYSHNGTTLTVRECVIECSDYYCIQTNDGGLSRDVYVQNCICYGAKAGGRTIRADTSDDINCQNVSAYTATNSTVFYYTDCANCIGINNGAAVTYDNCTGDYNIGDDTSAPGVNSIDNETTAIWKSVAGGSEDLHLADGATAADDAGDDLSGTFTVDIDDETRVDWDIGADEYVSAPAGNAPRRMLMGVGK